MPIKYKPTRKELKTKEFQGRKNEKTGEHNLKTSKNASKKIITTSKPKKSTYESNVKQSKTKTQNKNVNYREKQEKIRKHNVIKNRSTFGLQRIVRRRTDKYRHVDIKQYYAETRYKRAKSINYDAIEENLKNFQKKKHFRKKERFLRLEAEIKIGRHKQYISTKRIDANNDIDYLKGNIQRQINKILESYGYKHSAVKISKFRIVEEVRKIKTKEGRIKYGKTKKNT